LVVLSSPLIFQQRSQIVDFARQKRLPTVSLFTSFPRIGGLVAYGPNVASMHMRAANYIHRVLSGTKPNDLPIERPSRFELVINLKTAEALAGCGRSRFIGPRSGIKFAVRGEMWGTSDARLG
jgi:putative ABC transport system substrate-binding protein